MIFRLGAYLVLAYLTAESNGFAIKDCICTREHSPVCASNGITYTNECSFKCDKKSDPNIEIRFRGTCKDSHEEHKECNCPENHNPVCGSNGVTYENECALDCEKVFDENLLVERQGACDGVKTKLTQLKDVIVAVFNIYLNNQPQCDDDDHNDDNDHDHDADDHDHYYNADDDDDNDHDHDNDDDDNHDDDHDHDGDDEFNETDNEIDIDPVMLIDYSYYFGNEEGKEAESNTTPDT